jgi:hypothetical protein
MTLPCLPAHGAVAATVGNVAELLDVDVHQLARRGAFIAADHPTAAPVQMRQPSHPLPAQHPVHRGRVETQVVGDLSRTPPPQHPHLDDPPLAAGRGAARLRSGRLDRSTIPASPYWR